MEEEIWKIWKITKSNNGGLWEVSNFGRVRRNGKITKQGWGIHRVVAELFIPNPDNKPCVDHIDTNINNNRVDNLRWVTYIENNNNPLTKIHQCEAQQKRDPSTRKGPKGQTPWNKGLSTPLETRKKQSEVRKRYLKNKYINLD